MGGVRDRRRISDARGVRPVRRPPARVLDSLTGRCVGVWGCGSVGAFEVEDPGAQHSSFRNPQSAMMGVLTTMLDLEPGSVETGSAPGAPSGPRPLRSLS